MQRIIEDEEYRNELIEKKLYSVDKGIKKAKLRELIDISSRTTFSKALETPLMKQFIKDYNINIIESSQFIKF